MNSPIRTLREALQPFTDNSPGGKYRTRPEDFDAAKAAYEATTSADDGIDWRQRAVDAEEMLREVLKDYDRRFGTVPAQPLHKQLVRFVGGLDAPPPAAQALSEAVAKLLSEPDALEYPDRGVYDAIDRDAPFWSETALFELVGKEAARTLLARRRKVLELLSTAHVGSEPVAHLKGRSSTADPLLSECKSMLQVAQARLRDLVGRIVDHEASATIGAIEDVIDKIDACSSHEPSTDLAAGIEWLKGEISDGDAYLRDYPDSDPELEQQAARKNLLTAIAGVSQAPPDAGIVQMLDDLVEAAKHHAVHGASRANEKLLEAKRQNILNYDWCLRAASKEAETEGASPSPCVFPRADEDGRHGGWTLDQHMLTAIYKETRTDEFAPSEEGIEAVLLAYEKLFGSPMQPPTAVPGVAGVEPWQVPLWEAINRYVRACRGDPSKHVYGNTLRQTAVSEVNDIVRSAAQPSSAEPVAYRRFLDPQYDYSDRYRYRDATSIGVPEGWEPLYATPRTSRVDAEDAARWRALIGCARVRVLGSAGIYRRNANGSMHLGIEFWTHHETPSEPSALEDLINFATLAAMDPTKSTEQV